MKQNNQNTSVNSNFEEEGFPLFLKSNSTERGVVPSNRCAKPRPE